MLDAALQFQPFMFGQGFVEHLHPGQRPGQPFVIGDLITHVGHFLAPDIAVWNTLFALIQLAIGVGLLFRRTVRPALASPSSGSSASGSSARAWACCSPVRPPRSPARPGSVLIYGLLGLMAWPRPRPAAAVERSDRPRRRRLLGRRPGHRRIVTPLAVWAGYWSLAAVLFLLPDNRTSTSMQSAIAGMAEASPAGTATS